MNTLKDFMNNNKKYVYLMISILIIVVVIIVTIHNDFSFRIRNFFSFSDYECTEKLCSICDKTIKKLCFLLKYN